MFRKSTRYYDALYGSKLKDYVSEASRVSEILHEQAANEPRSVLDVGCGTGLHLQHLGDAFEREGVDISAEMLEIARGRLPGVPLHEGDMATFDLKKTFDAVICLFSSIGYAGSLEVYRQTVENFARHTSPGGVVLVEPWLSPDAYKPGFLHALHVDEPDLKISRMNISEQHGRMSVFDMHHLVATPEGVEHFVEHHELILLTREEQLQAYLDAGLDAEFDEEGIYGRGLFIGRKTA